LTGRRPYNPRVVFTWFPGSTVGRGVVGGAQQAGDSTDPKGGSAVAGSSRFIGFGWTVRGMGRDTIRRALRPEVFLFGIAAAHNYEVCNYKVYLQST